MVDRQVTDQRLDVSVVCGVLAARLRDDRDIRDESIEIVAYPFTFERGKDGVAHVIGGVG